jgi:hypothetical protein
MNTNIAKALVAAQKEFGPALKTNTNPHFRSKYADLSACVEAVIDALNSNNIMLMQNTHESDSGVIVETIFLHESGESISNGRLHVPAAKNDPQGYGSALTYARRYSLMAACGIAPEDDDGNSAAAAKNAAKSVAKDVHDNLPPEQKAFVQETANHIIAALSIDEIDRAHEIFYRKNLDSEEKMAIWALLDSKQRSALKSYDNSLKEVK